MPREKRCISENGVYEITVRTRDLILFRDEEDRVKFTALLGAYFADDAQVYGFAFAETNAHFIVGTGNKGIAERIKPMLTGYARYYNKKYIRTGKLFFDRYKSVPVSADRIAEATADLNGDMTGGAQEVYTASLLIPNTPKGTEKKRKVKSVPELRKKLERAAPDNGEEKPKNQMDVWLL